MFTTETEIVTIGEGLLARTLPKPAWTHPAHFAAAVWLIRCRPDLPAHIHMPGSIRAYNEATGLVNTLLAGPCGDKKWLLAYWSPELLFSPLARAAWIAPDRVELPFEVRKEAPLF
jgi:hypothetical protein